MRSPNKGEGAQVISRGSGFHVEVLGTTRELALLRNEWRELSERCSSATPFQSPEWLLAWCDAFEPASLWVLVVRSGGRLVGLAPFFVWNDGETPTLAVLGAGLSDYLDVLIDTHHTDAVLELMARVLEGEGRAFRACRFHDLAPCSQLLRMRGLVGFRDERSRDATCPVVCIPAGAPGLDGVVPAAMLRRFRHDFRRAQRRADVRLELADEISFEPLARAFFRLHTARFHERGGGMVADARALALHDAFMRELLALRSLRLFALRTAQGIVAALYAVRHRDTLYCYLQGFDPAYATLSPGVLIVGAVLEHALAEGLRAVDFLRGNEPYKYAWGARDVWSERRTLMARLSG